MPAPTISTLPTPPSRSDAPDVFSDRADSFLGALPTFVSQANALGSYLDGVGTAVDADAIAAAASAAAASTSASNASTAAAAAAATADVTLWVSGTTYSAGANVWSPISYQTYRRKTTGGGTTDPSSDATNWEQISGAESNFTVISSGGSLFASNRQKIAASTAAINLPSSPSAGWYVIICKTDPSASAFIGVNGNGSTIEGSASYSLGAGIGASPVAFVYDGTTWQVIGDRALCSPGAVTNNAMVLFDGTNGRLTKQIASMGTTGQVLTSQGSGNAPIFSDAPQNLAIIQTVNASGASSIDFTGLGTTYDYYVIESSGFTLSSSATLLLRASTDNGSTYLSGATDYAYAQMIGIPPDVYPAFNSSIGASQIPISNYINFGAQGQTYIRLFGAGKSQLFTTSTLASSTEQRVLQNSGNRTVSGAVNAVRLFASSGTVTGTFKLYGVKA